VFGFGATTPERFARPYDREQYLQVSENAIVVRPATVADGEEIGEAHASAWEVAYVDLFEPDVLRHAAARRRTMWSQRLARSDFDFDSLLVADQGGRVVGFSEFGKDREETGRGEVFGFYLHPAAWGQGAATQLMAASLRRLANLGLDPVVVWTHPGAGRAQSFYVKCGFRATGRSRVETLGSGIDAPEVEFVRVRDS
jgi:RimJ/RimL family protein N-acetyltransferase